MRAPRPGLSNGSRSGEGIAIAAESSGSTVEIQELAVHYQPQFSLVDGELAGFEALLRWQDPSGELILPADFLNELRHRGMLRNATMEVLDTVTAQIREWRRDLPAQAAIGVNIPSMILSDQSLLKDLRRLVRESPEIAQHLVLEVSARSPWSELSEGCAEHRRLCGNQIRLALDDIDIGLQSAQFVRSLPIDFAKLDNSVIAALPADRRSAAVARSVIALGHGHGRKVFAVGIEHARQCEFLADHGCDLGQGFHFAPVEPPMTATRWLRAG